MDVKDIAKQLEDCDLLGKIQDGICSQLADETDEPEKLRTARLLNLMTTINVLLIGRTGYGKSALITALTGQEAKEGGVIPTTKCATRYSHGTITFIDTKGFEVYTDEEYKDLEDILRQEDVNLKVHVAFVLQSAGDPIVANPILRAMALLLRYRVPFCSLVTKPYSGNNRTQGHILEMKRLMAEAATKVAPSKIPPIGAASTTKKSKMAGVRLVQREQFASTSCHAFV